MIPLGSLSIRPDGEPPPVSRSVFQTGSPGIVGRSRPGLLLFWTDQEPVLIPIYKCPNLRKSYSWDQGSGVAPSPQSSCQIQREKPWSWGGAGASYPARLGGLVRSAMVGMRDRKRKAPLGTRGASYALVPGKGQATANPVVGTILFELRPALRMPGACCGSQLIGSPPKEKAPAWFSRATGASL